MGKTWTLTAIKEILDPKKEVIIMYEDFIVLSEVDESGEVQKMKMLFKKAGHRYVQVDLEKILNLIVEKLAPHVDVKQFLKELIKLHSAPEEILELNKRLEKSYVKISGTKGCYSLMIGGKKGKPYEFNLV